MYNIQHPVYVRVEQSDGVGHGLVKRKVLVFETSTRSNKGQPDGQYSCNPDLILNSRLRRLLQLSKKLT
jgi:hypothetical protein